MEDQIGVVLHWSNQKEPAQAKSKDEIIRRNLDRIWVSATTPLPSNPPRYSQVSLVRKKKNPGISQAWGTLVWFPLDLSIHSGEDVYRF